MLDNVDFFCYITYIKHFQVKCDAPLAQSGRAADS